MKKLILSVFLAFCVIANLTFLPVSAVAETSETSTYSGVYAQIDEYLGAAFKSAHIPAASVAVADENGIKFGKAYGKCPDTDTPFLLGSVSKSFTALCIMKLSEDGLIDINAPVSTYLPNAKYGDTITVLQLLNHTSGLGEHDNFNNYKISAAQGKHVYSNVNYTILGKIIESVSGKTYEEFVEETVFQPLGMLNSAASLEKSKQNGLIQGCENYFGFNVPKNPRYPKGDGYWITVPAGYLSSSANDLGKYLQSYIKTLNGEKVVVSPSGALQMFENGVYVDGEIPYIYAMGWNKIKEPLATTVYRHSGLVETGMSCIYVIPELGLGVAVLANVNDYLVAQNMISAIDWSVTLMLLGMQPNKIGSWQYPLYHALYDLLFIIIIAIAVLPLALVKPFIKRLNLGKLWVKILLNLLLHTVLPTLVLLSPIIFVSTPLWVVSSFVPDLFITLLISACLLYCGGALKIFLWIYNFKKGANK